MPFTLCLAKGCARLRELRVPRFRAPLKAFLTLAS
jgi:hypothetical protein